MSHRDSRHLIRSNLYFCHIQFTRHICHFALFLSDFFLLFPIFCFSPRLIKFEWSMVCSFDRRIGPVSHLSLSPTPTATHTAGHAERVPDNSLIDPARCSSYYTLLPTQLFTLLFSDPVSLTAINPSLLLSTVVEPFDEPVNSSNKVECRHCIEALANKMCQPKQSLKSSQKMGFIRLETSDSTLPIDSECCMCHCHSVSCTC